MLEKWTLQVISINFFIRRHLLHGISDALHCSLAYKSQNVICHTGAQNLSHVIFGFFLFRHIICVKALLTKS